MRYIQYVWLALFLPSISFGAIDLDVDKNGATDVNRGGSNATTAAGARSNLGLGNVTNTSDANKPVSTAQQSALDLKSNITCFADASAFNTCFGLDWITAAGIGLGTTDSPAFIGLTLGIANTSFGTLGFYGNSKTYPFSLWSDGADVGSLGWKLPSTLPSTASLISSSTLGYLSYVDPATFLTPTGVGGALTVTATGFDGNLTTSDNTLQEIAQKVDDLVLGSGGGYTNLTSFVAQTAWRVFYSDGSGDVKELALGSDGEYLKSNGAALAPSWATPSGAAHDAVTLGTDAAAIFGLSTQEITLDSQTANYFFAAPNGSAGDPTFRALVAADLPFVFDGDTIGEVVVVQDDGSGNPALPFTVDLSALTDTTSILTGKLSITAIDDTPVNDETAAPISSNWAYDHAAAADPHSGYVLESALGSNVGTFLATPSSANLRGAVTDESGTGALVFAGGDIAAATATTATAGDNDTSVATTAFVQTSKKSGIQPVCFVIPAAVATDDYPIFKAPAALTITGGSIHVYAIGETSSSVTGGLDECTGTGGTCSSVTAVDSDIVGTTGNDVADDGTLTNGTIASGNWILWRTQSISGANTSVSVCFSYTLD